jgi:hypothetical protein
MYESKTHQRIVVKAAHFFLEAAWQATMDLLLGDCDTFGQKERHMTLMSRKNGRLTVCWS